MLEEKVEQTRCIGEGRGEQKIALGVAELGIDERAGLQQKLFPLDFFREGRWNFTAKEGSGIDGIAEAGFEKFVMRLMDRRFGHDVLYSWFLVPCSLFLVPSSWFLFACSVEGGAGSAGRRAEAGGRKPEFRRAEAGVSEGGGEGRKYEG